MSNSTVQNPDLRDHRICQFTQNTTIIVVKSPVNALKERIHANFIDRFVKVLNFQSYGHSCTPLFSRHGLNCWKTKRANSPQARTTCASACHAWRVSSERLGFRTCL
jgi:hypothetical protein